MNHMAKIVFLSTGRELHGLVDPTRPFVVNIPRNLIDGLGRPLRGISNTYDYACEADAMGDYRAAKKAGLRPICRDFSDRDNVRLLGK
jgi:hypothetical protein